MKQERKYQNIDERFGGDELANLADYQELAPDWEFVEENDQIKGRMSEADNWEVVAELAERMMRLRLLRSWLTDNWELVAELAES